MSASRKATVTVVVAVDVTTSVKFAVVAQAASPANAAMLPYCHPPALVESKEDEDERGHDSRAV